jgi:hypothetical protein
MTNILTYCKLLHYREESLVFYLSRFIGIFGLSVLDYDMQIKADLADYKSLFITINNTVLFLNLKKIFLIQQSGFLNRHLAQRNCLYFEKIWKN